MIELLEKFMNVALAPMAFVLIFITQLKVMSMLRANRDLIMFYGKQMEELRKMASHQPRRPRISSEDTGLYEVLSE